MAVTKLDYPADEVAAGLSVLVEVFTILGEYRGKIALVGGWVPYVMNPTAEPPHVGSLDVDMAIDFLNITDDSRATIRALLEEHGYIQSGQQPHTFVRTLVDPSGRVFRVPVDLHAGELGGTGRRRRHQRIQDLCARKAKGCDLVFDRVMPFPVRGRMPNGHVAEVTINVAGAVPFLVTKAGALSDRLKDTTKDAYDIFYFVSHYSTGVVALAGEFVICPRFAGQFVKRHAPSLRTRLG